MTSSAVIARIVTPAGGRRADRGDRHGRPRTSRIGVAVGSGGAGQEAQRRRCRRPDSPAATNARSSRRATIRIPRGRDGRARRRCTWRRRGAGEDDRADPSAASLPERAGSRLTPDRRIPLGGIMAGRRRHGAANPRTLTADEPDRGAPNRGPTRPEPLPSQLHQGQGAARPPPARAWRARSAGSRG